MYSQYPNMFVGGGNISNVPPKTQRLSNSTSYKRPNKTVQEMLSTDDIKDKLKGYLSIDNINNVQIGTHLRYFAKDKKTGEYKFRLGGILFKKDNDKPYVILSNGDLSWSAQKETCKFYKKMTQEEEKETIIKDVKKIRDKFTEKLVEKDDIIEDNNKQIRDLRKKLEKFKH
jgi:hypothetical protein